MNRLSLSARRAGGGPLATMIAFWPTPRRSPLRGLGRFSEARVEFERAAGLAGNARDRTLMLERAAACARR